MGPNNPIDVLCIRLPGFEMHRLSCYKFTSRLQGLNYYMPYRSFVMLQVFANLFAAKIVNPSFPTVLSHYSCRSILTLEP